MSKTVYLSGPIAGLNYDGATNWRDAVRAELHDFGIVGLCPMRGKEFLRDRKGGISTAPLIHAQATDSAITTRDRRDTQSADMVLVNILGATKISIGTMIELGWADAARVPVVLLMERSGSPYDHPIVRAIAGYRTHDMEEALAIIVADLCPARPRPLYFPGFDEHADKSESYGVGMHVTAGGVGGEDEPFPLPLQSLAGRGRPAHIGAE